LVPDKDNVSYVSNEFDKFAKDNVSSISSNFDKFFVNVLFEDLNIKFGCTLDPIISSSDIANKVLFNKFVCSPAAIHSCSYGYNTSDSIMHTVFYINSVCKSLIGKNYHLITPCNCLLFNAICEFCKHTHDICGSNSNFATCKNHVLSSVSTQEPVLSSNDDKNFNFDLVCSTVPVILPTFVTCSLVKFISTSTCHLYDVTINKQVFPGYWAKKFANVCPQGWHNVDQGSGILCDTFMPVNFNIAGLCTATPPVSLNETLWANVNAILHVTHNFHCIVFYILL
jgi:hypothetical protein